MRTHTFYLSGTHCASCKIFIEDTLNEYEPVHDVAVDLENELLRISVDTHQSPEELATILTSKIQSHGYRVSIQKGVEEKKNDDIWPALLIGFVVLTLFFLLQKSGLLNIGIGGQITPVTSFLIGLIASVSSCLAVVGGLVLSLSAKISQDNRSDTRTFILFHFGRLFSFAVLGGALGLLGGFIGIQFAFTAILGIIASTVMIFLGFHLIGVFKKNKIVISSGLFNFFKDIEHTRFAPLMLGFATFFLPCGFTQSMQISALSSGSFISGFAIMFAFALGTLPMLAFLSFGSASLAHGRHSSLFFKSAGIVVIGLGLFAFLSGLAALGIINPLFTI